MVEAYIHGEGRIGVLVELNSETDFVARTTSSGQLAHEVAMQVAATDPRWITREDVPEDVVAGERKIYEEKARSCGKPEQVLGRIVQGKLEYYFKQFVLLEQPYIRDPGRRRSGPCHGGRREGRRKRGDPAVRPVPARRRGLRPWTGQTPTAARPRRGRRRSGGRDRRRLDGRRAARPMFHRVLLKLSGDAFAPPDRASASPGKPPT